MKIPWFNKTGPNEAEIEPPFVAGLEETGSKPEIDFNSATWKKMENILLSSIQAARVDNDSLHLNEQKTAVVRGKIRAYKDLLALNSAGNAAKILDTTFTAGMERNKWK